MNLLLLVVTVAAVWGTLIFCACYVGKKLDEAREQALNEWLRERSQRHE